MPLYQTLDFHSRTNKNNLKGGIIATFIQFVALEGVKIFFARRGGAKIFEVTCCLRLSPLPKKVKSFLHDIHEFFSKCLGGGLIITPLYATDYKYINVEMSEK